MLALAARVLALAARLVLEPCAPDSWRLVLWRFDVPRAELWRLELGRDALFRFALDPPVVFCAVLLRAALFERVLDAPDPFAL